MEPFAGLLMVLGLVGLYAFQYRIGFPTRYSLLPYQRGMLYRGGRPVREVGPGSHRVFRRLEKIVFLDTRPIQVKVEHRAVALLDGTTAIYGFVASAEVRDVKKALYVSASYTQMPAFVTLLVTRGYLGRCDASQIKNGQAALTEEIFATVQARLAASGFELLSFRFSELYSVVPRGE